MFASGAATVWWRALAALAVGLTVTFVSDHSAVFGLTVFGVFALAVSVIFAWNARIARSRIAALGYGVAAATAIACGIVAFLGEGLAVLVPALAGFAAVTGTIELGLGLRYRRQSVHATDGIVVGILSLILALVVVVIPFDFANAWETVAKDGTVVSGTVTAEVFVVGVFGAYAFVLGVFLAIAAVSARFAEGAKISRGREPARVSGEG